MVFAGNMALNESSSLGLRVRFCCKVSIHFVVKLCVTLQPAEDESAPCLTFQRKHHNVERHVGFIALLNWNVEISLAISRAKFWSLDLSSESRVRDLCINVEFLDQVHCGCSRVVMPLLLEEYRIAQMYMVTKIQEQQTGGGEGVEVLINRPFENEELGQGQYTSKIYHLQSKIPTWLSTFVPTKYMYIEEEAWNAYPKCKTVLKCPYLNRFTLTIETIHVADNGNSPNVHNLNKEALAARKVENLDIASSARDYWSYIVGGPEIDLTKFKSEKTGRGLLTPGWQATCNPVMTAYKLVTVDVPYWGFGYRLEQALLGAERSLFSESHKRCFHWIDEWFGLTYEDVRRMEMQNDVVLNQKLGKQLMDSGATEKLPSTGIAGSSSETVKKDASLRSSVSVRS